MARRPNRLRGGLPAARGTAWLMESLAMLRAQAGRLLFMAVVMQVILSLAQVPLLGILIVLSVPALGAGMLEAFHVTARGGLPTLRLLFKPLLSSPQRGRFFAMGAMVFLVGIVTISILVPASGNLPDEALLLRLQQGDVDALAELDPAFVRSLLMAFLVSIGISGTLSYLSIPLIWFYRRPFFAALGEGMQALLVHWKPFLMLGFGVMAVFLPIALLTGLLLRLSTAGGVVAVIATGLVMMLLLLFQLVLFGTQYCAARDIFGEIEEGDTDPGRDQRGDPGEEKTKEDQLVA